MFMRRERSLELVLVCDDLFEAWLRDSQVIPLGYDWETVQHQWFPQAARLFP